MVSMRTPLTALQVRAVIMASSLAVPRLVHHAGRQAVMSASVRDDGEVSGLNVLTRLMEEDRDSALEVDTSGVIEDVDPRGSDDELDLGLDALPHTIPAACCYASMVGRHRLLLWLLGLLHASCVI